MTKATKRKPIVLAGNTAEFTRWCVENRVQPQNAIYLHSSEQLLGRPYGSAIIRVGSWWTNPMARDFLLKAVEKPL